MNEYIGSCHGNWPPHTRFYQWGFPVCFVCVGGGVDGVKEWVRGDFPSDSIIQHTHYKEEEQEIYKCACLNFSSAKIRDFQIYSVWAFCSVTDKIITKIGDMYSQQIPLKAKTNNKVTLSLCRWSCWEWATLSPWVTWSFVTMNLGTGVYFELIPHTVHRLAAVVHQLHQLKINPQQTRVGYWKLQL